MVKNTVKKALNWFFAKKSKNELSIEQEIVLSTDNSEKQNETEPLSKFIFEKDYLFIEKLESVLERNISKSECKAEEIAEEMNLTYDTLNNNLKRITGCSIKKYFSKYRMQRAKVLMDSTDKSISEICYTVGSTNLQTFSRSFKREFGKSPRMMDK